MAVSTVDLTRPGIWKKLFPHALALMAHLESVIEHATWTFGGGTVLMLRIGHRQSKDIDLFVPDPQYLGHVNPRLSDTAELITTDYQESTEFIKLFLPEGEIDIVVGTPLTDNPFEVVNHRGREIKVETSAEIIAKKMWHRGDRAKARDLYDLCAVADLEPQAIAAAAPFFARHGAAFIERLTQRAAQVEAEFAEIDVIAHGKPFGACMQQAREIIESTIRRRSPRGPLRRS